MRRGRLCEHVRGGISVSGFGMAAVAATITIVGQAAAAEIKFPKDKPKIELKVPEGWSVRTTSSGLELRSPDKNAYVVADIVKRDKTAVDAWTKLAVEKMEAEGVVFDKAWKPKPQKNAPLVDSAVVSTVPVDSGIPMFARRAVKAEAEKEAAEKAPRMLGAPPIPEEEGLDGGAELHVNAADGAKVADTTPAQSSPSPSMASAPSFTRQSPSAVMQTGRTQPPDAAEGEAPSKIGGMNYRVAQYFGAKRDGKPVDVQLLVMNMGKDQLFMIEHESASADNRTVSIVESTKQVH